MKRKFAKVFLWLFVLFVGLVGYNTVFAVGETQITSTGKDRLRDLVVDSDGSAIVGWVNDTTLKAYVQKVDKNGKIVWRRGGVQASEMWNWNTHMISDGNGGVILVDSDSSSNYVYLIKVSKNGNLSWGADGIKMKKYNWITDVIPDGNGGAEFLSSSTEDYVHYKYYAQRVNSNGDLVYGSVGKELTFGDGVGHLQGLSGEVVRIGNHIAVLYQIYSGGTSVYLQYMNNTFDIEWTTELPASVLNSGDEFYGRMYSNGLGGVLIMNGKKYVSVDGNGVILSGADALEITSDQNASFQAISSENGNLVVVWQSKRGGVDNFDIYGQMIDKDGNKLWSADGVAIANNQDLDESLATSFGPDNGLSYSSGDGSVTIAIDQYRGNNQIGAAVQKIAEDGTLSWNISSSRGGVPVMGRGVPKYMQLSASKTGGSFVAWQVKDENIDPNNGYIGNIFTAHIGLDGKLIKTEDDGIYRDFYLSKVQRGGTYGNIKNQSVNVQINKFRKKDRTYWMKVRKFNKSLKIASVGSVSAVKSLNSYWKIKSNLYTTSPDRKKISFVFKYKVKDLKKAGLKKKNIALYYYSDVTKTWTKLSNVKHNKIKHTFKVVFGRFLVQDNYFAIRQK